jgi:hypothetical protein
MRPAVLLTELVRQLTVADASALEGSDDQFADLVGDCVDVRVGFHAFEQGKGRTHPSPASTMNTDLGEEPSLVLDAVDTDVMTVSVLALGDNLDPRLDAASQQ